MILVRFKGTSSFKLTNVIAHVLKLLVNGLILQTESTVFVTVLYTWKEIYQLLALTPGCAGFNNLPKCVKW